MFSSSSSFFPSPVHLFYHLKSHADPLLPPKRYTVYRRVVGYYSDNPTGGSGGEDAFDMRKSLNRDVEKKYVRENGENFLVKPEDL